MNVYDFDKTIYPHDSTVDFYLSQLRRNPLLCRYWPRQLFGFAGYYLFHRFDKTVMKSYFYSYLKGVKDIDGEVERFWDKNIHLIKDFYKENHQDDDLIISASATFLISAACRRLGITNILASDVDQYTGKVLSPNCHGQEKVERMQQAGYSLDIQQFYSDSLNDTPLAKLARESYLVKGNKIVPWPNYDKVVRK
ncbi:MAG: HAD-IB family phosphatase [Erysipelotrichaceae bacterium]|nr:HAD-IB family phosphatase [Erysipelotrichaceae bacterium]